jgi:hypothetical protein
MGQMRCFREQCFALTGAQLAGEFENEVALDIQRRQEIDGQPAAAGADLVMIWATCAASVLPKRGVSSGAVTKSPPVALSPNLCAPPP